MSEATDTFASQSQRRTERTLSAWKKPSKSALAPSASTEIACPLGQLATEAARLIRLQKALDADDGQGDPELLEALAKPDDFIRSSELRTEAQEHLHAIVRLAEHSRPVSLKGALFQLYLAAEKAQATDGYICSKLSSKDENALARRDRAIERLHRAALAQLETLVMDDDLLLLREHWLPRLYDAHAGCERAMDDRAGLVAEALMAPSTWQQHAANP